MEIYLSEHILDFDLALALADISPQRREQALRFRHEQGQRLCVLAYQLLKQGLNEQYGITGNPLFDYGDHGKPAIQGHPEIFFNLSHCREAAVCVLGDRPLGVDVESVGRYKQRLADYTMNTAELRLIAQTDRPDVAFTRLWTMKEARMKLTGEGITSAMKDVLADASDYRFHTCVAASQAYVYTVCERRLPGDSGNR